MSCASECVGRCKGGHILVEGKEVVDQLIVEADESSTNYFKIAFY